jgi:hypothetical protein
MTAWVWLLVPAIALAIWAFREKRRRENDLGSVSAQWLHEYRGKRARSGEGRCLRTPRRPLGLRVATPLTDAHFARARSCRGCAEPSTDVKPLVGQNPVA